MKLIAALVAAILLFAGSALAQDRMPATSILREGQYIDAPTECGVFDVRFFATPGLDEAPIWKAIAVAVAPGARPFIIFVFDDETNEQSSGKAYVDYDGDRMVDETVDVGPDDDLAAVVCAALPKVKSR